MTMHESALRNSMVCSFTGAELLPWAEAKVEKLQKSVIAAKNRLDAISSTAFNSDVMSRCQDRLGRLKLDLRQCRAWVLIFRREPGRLHTLMNEDILYFEITSLVIGSSLVSSDASDAQTPLAYQGFNIPDPKVPGPVGGDIRTLSVKGRMCWGHGQFPAGKSIRVLDSETGRVELCSLDSRDGVVDPFLLAPARDGELFWALLVPDLDWKADDFRWVSGNTYGLRVPPE